MAEGNNSNNGKRGLGKLEGQMDTLLTTVLPGIKEQINDLSISFDNHLKHHEVIEEKSGDRVFHVLTIVLQVALMGLITYFMLRPR